MRHSKKNPVEENHNGHPSATAEPSAPTYSDAAEWEVRSQLQTDGEDVALATNGYDDPASAGAGYELVMAGQLMEKNVHPTRTPIPPPTIKNKVYGSYRGVNGTFELELRIDTDGPTPLNIVSGDYYTMSGATKNYYGSFMVRGVSVVTAGGVITITGLATTTWVTAYTKIKLTLNQTNLGLPLAPAHLQWIHGTTGAPGALYLCNYAKRGYRTVRLEQDRTSDVATSFTSYNTGALPSGGPARVLTINGAYAEAGVDMASAGVTNVVPLALAGIDAKWTDAELHNAMTSHFSLYNSSKPAWDVWLLHAQDHVIGPGLYGIMFDQIGLQRQGCAVFYRGIGGDTPEQKRLQVYTCVHELGHCFNLLHSWQKCLATPPKPNNVNALSWMNYPWGYPAGPVAFWNAFGFKFEKSELEHIRHGYRNNVIMGGNPFGTGSSLQQINALFEKPVENNATLELELEAHRTYYLGEPVDLEIKLKTTSFKHNEVISSLHPDFGFVTVGIKKPGGEVVVYEPIGEKCISPERVVLNVENPSIYENAYIGFHKDGFIFDQPGKYELRAVYTAEDGSRIVSDMLTLRVKSPMTAEDDELADAFLEEEIGYLLKFKGSDAPYLQRGNEMLNQVIDKYPDHPLAVYAQYVKGVNAQRAFKTITPTKDLMVREPDLPASTALLTQAVEKSKNGQGLDNIRLNKTMQMLAQAYQREGNQSKAKATMTDMVTFFNKQPLKPHVKALIAKQAASALQAKP
jgi:hypothetical protein